MADWISPVLYVVGICAAAFFGAALCEPKIGPKSKVGRYWHVVGLIASVLIISISIFMTLELMR